MERILLLNENNPQIDLFVRTVTEGEEICLVKEFIEYYCSRFLKKNKNKNLAVFVEPRILSGFPDVVFATYLPSIERNLTEERKRLDTNDLKVLVKILHSNEINGAGLISSLKLPEKQTISSLEHLIDAKMITYKKGSWKPRPMRDVFSIEKLVAVEAKINNVNRVIQQTIVNTWFASHSYALTTTTAPQSGTINAFHKHKIGLYCKDRSFIKIVEAPSFALPSSYISLKFNEWICNSIMT